MLTCGVNKPGERMSKLKIKVEDCVDEGEVGEVEVGSEEEVLEKEEVLTTGWEGEVDEEEDEGENEGEDEEQVEEGIGIEMETICDICHFFNVTFS